MQNSWVNTANQTQRNELLATSKKNNHSIASINSGQGSLQNSSQLYAKQHQIMNNSVVTQVGRQLSSKKTAKRESLTQKKQQAQQP